MKRPPVACLSAAAKAVALIAWVGQPAVGAEPLTARLLTASTVLDIGQPAVSDNGRVAVVNSSFLPNIGPEQGLVVGTSSAGLSTRLATGSPLPGTTGSLEFFNAFLQMQANNRGDVAFAASLDTAADGVDESNDRGLWISSPSSTRPDVRLVMIESGEASGAGGAVFSRGSPTSNDDYALNNLGQVVFASTLRHDAGLGVNFRNDSGVWFSSPGGDRLLAREGDAPPGVANARFGPLGGVDITLNDAGQTTFFADLQPGSTTRFDLPRITNDNNVAIFKTQRGSPELELVAQEGGPAPGVFRARFDFSNGFATEQAPSINNAGRIAFHAGLQPGPGVTEANRFGVWADGDAGLELRLRSGDPTPGLDGERLGLFRSVKQNNRGDLVVVGRTVGDNQSRQALWRSEGDGFELLAAADEPVPGVPGAVFSQFDNGGFDGTTAINDHGDVVFSAFFNTSEGGFGLSGLFAYSTVWDQVVPLAIEGEPLALGRGRSEELGPFILETANVSNTGEVFLPVSFERTATQALAVIQIPVVPEPSGAALALIALAYSFTRFGRVNE